jgi:hypothetical protein
MKLLPFKDIPVFIFPLPKTRYFYIFKIAGKNQENSV